MDGVKEYSKEVFDYFKFIQITPPDQFNYKLKRTLETFEQLYNRFCPYEVGDRVQLIKTPEILEGSGWYGSKHFLIEGSAATVYSTDFIDGSFVFGLKFDDDSYIDHKTGDAIPLLNKYIFNFSENWLQPLK